MDCTEDKDSWRPDYPRLADIADIPVIPAPLPLVRRWLVPPVELLYWHQAAALPAPLQPLVPGMDRDIQLMEQRPENIPHTYTRDRPADWYTLDRPDNWGRFQVGTSERWLAALVLAPRLQAETPVPWTLVGALVQLSR
jgi:hypothetical protein